MRVVIYQDAGGGWRWRAVDGNHRIIADSAEAYQTRSGATKGLDNVMNEFRGEVEVLAQRLPGARRTADEGGVRIEGAVYDQLAVYAAEGDHDHDAAPR